SNVIPSEFQALDPGFYNGATISDNGVEYLKGYDLLNIPTITDGSSYPLMGVPLRPNQKPHLVSRGDFDLLKKTPLPGDSAQPAASRVPPNAFKSSGLSAELQSRKGVQTLSCAIVGCVNVLANYPPQIPCGFIVVANGAGITPTNTAGQVNVDYNAAGLTADSYGGGTGDIFTDVLMYNTVFVTKNGAMSENAGAIGAIQQWKNQQAKNGQAQTPVPANLADKLDGPSPKQAAADGIDPSETPSACTNYNSAPGDPASDSTCVQFLSSMASVYGTNLPGGAGSGKLNGLMAIEKEKAGVIDPRPSGGPATVTGLNNTCTGMKSFNLAGIPASAPVNFGAPPTLGGLMGDFKAYSTTAANGGIIYSQLVTKLYQMQPNASQADVDGVLNSSVPMGTVRYIWLDSNGKFQVTDDKSLPSWINPNNILPDGSTIVADTGDVAVDRTFVNIINEQGFPSPWDCPGGPATQRNAESWTRSSGFN
ncbi:MAG: hypothetical protein ACRD3W_10975, partial [Terriglobales bacterium]